MVFLLRLGLSPHARLGLEAPERDKLSRGTSPPGRGGSGEEPAGSAVSVQSPAGPASLGAAACGGLQRPGPAQPCVRGGADIPDTLPGPSLENPLEILFPVVVSVASGSGGAGGGERPRRLRAARGVGLRGLGCERRPAPPGLALRTSGATRWHPVPRRRVCAGAGLGPRPSWGGRAAPAAGRGPSLELPVREGEVAGLPRPVGGNDPKLRRSRGVPCHPRSWPCRAWGGRTETHQRPPAAPPAPRAPRLCVLSTGGWARWGEARPGPPGTCGTDVGGARAGSTEGPQGEAPGSSPDAPVPPGEPPAGPPLPARPWPRPLGASGEWSPKSGFPEPPAGAPASDPGRPEPAGSPAQGLRPRV